MRSLLHQRIGAWISLVFNSVSLLCLPVASDPLRDFEYDFGDRNEIERIQGRESEQHETTLLSFNACFIGVVSKQSYSIRDYFSYYTLTLVKEIVFQGTENVTELPTLFNCNNECSDSIASKNRFDLSPLEITFRNYNVDEIRSDLLHVCPGWNIETFTITLVNFPMLKSIAAK